MVEFGLEKYYYVNGKRYQDVTNETCDERIMGDQEVLADSKGIQISTSE